MVEIIQGSKGIKMGILDDMAPDGSPNTACQNYLEGQLQAGHYEIVREEIKPGVFKETIVLILGEINPDDERK